MIDRSSTSDLSKPTARRSRSVLCTGEGRGVQRHGAKLDSWKRCEGSEDGDGDGLSFVSEGERGGRALRCREEVRERNRKMGTR